LTRTRLALIQKQADAKQKLANLLFQKCSSLAQDNVFGGISTTFLNLMECFDSVDDLANLSLPELTSFIAGSGRGRFKDPDAIAKAVQAAVRGSYRLPKVMNDSVNQALSLYVSLIQTLKAQIDALDTSIEKHFDIIPNELKTIPGIGKVYSAGIIAEIGDIGRFDSHASLAKYAGLVWSQHQSGNYEAESTHLIKSGNRYLRYYLLEAANSVRRCDSEFKRYYDLKYKEVNVGQHKRALALTARKLVRLVFRLLKDNRLYIP
jgi:transposase